MIRSGGDTMLDSLHLLMQASWQAGRLPTMWAVADVRLVPKETRPTTFGELRPISLLSIVGKLMEAVVHCRVARLAEEHGWVRPYQTGSKAGRGTVDALAELQERAHSAFAKMSCPISEAIDISHAYDNA